MAKPPMGIWRGMLSGRMGNFKFIYVDLLPDSHEERGIHRVRQKSTVREVLRRLSLEVLCFLFFYLNVATIILHTKGHSFSFWMLCSSPRFSRSIPHLCSRTVIKQWMTWWGWESITWRSWMWLIQSTGVVCSPLSTPCSNYAVSYDKHRKRLSKDSVIVAHFVTW